MSMTRLVPAILTIAMLAVSADTVSGQSYPTKPIRIVTLSIGGNSDMAARLIAQGLTGRLDQQVIVDNRPNSVIPAEIVAKAPPDGYTLLFMGNSLWMTALLQDVPYDPVKDFSTITLATNTPNILVVNPLLPAKSVKELIALAKTKPGELNYASPATGSTGHLAGELFKALTGIDMIHITYKAAPQALNDLIGGRVQLMFPTAPAVMPHVKSGRLRALAVTSAEPSALAPGLATVAAAGVPGYEAVVINALWAPAKTPAAIVKQLNQQVVRFLNTGEAKERLFSNGTEAVGSSPQQLAAAIEADTARWSKVIKDAGIRAN